MILFTLDIKGLGKTVNVYFMISVFTIAVDKIYAIFGHGVTSSYMTWMFLYPFLGGTMFYLFLEHVFYEMKNCNGYRLFFNLYNSGIAAFTVGSFMKGIFEIAGTGSPYTIWYFITGGLFVTFGLVILIKVKKS